MSSADVADEIMYLRDLVRDRSVTMAEVSGQTLRYLLALARIDEVLGKTAALGEDSPISTATDLADAEHAKHVALDDIRKASP